MNTPVLTYASKEMNNVSDNLSAMKNVVIISSTIDNAIQEYNKKQEELKSRGADAPINSQDLAKQIMADMASNYRNEER